VLGWVGVQSWDGKMNYSDGSLDEASAKQNALKEFFLNVKAAIRARGGVVGVMPAAAGAAEGEAVPQVWTAADHKFQSAIVAARVGVHKALCDSFDYTKAMEHLLGTCLCSFDR
jgi:hypothetical protein